MPHDPDAPPQPKAALRHHFRAARRALAPQERAEKSAQIAAHVLRWLEHREPRPATVALYLASACEADVDALIEPLQALGVRVAAPSAQGFALIESASTCREMGGQSWRAASGEPVEVPDLDIVLLPGVAFGRDGSRLGQGQAWFDRALEGSRATLIGVAFGCQIVDALPVQPHDVPVQWIVSEDGIVGAPLSAVS